MWIVNSPIRHDTCFLFREMSPETWHMLSLRFWMSKERLKIKTARILLSRRSLRDCITSIKSLMIKVMTMRSSLGSYPQSHPQLMRRENWPTVKPISAFSIWIVVAVILSLHSSIPQQHLLETQNFLPKFSPARIIIQLKRRSQP